MTHNNALSIDVSDTAKAIDVEIDFPYPNREFLTLDRWCSNVLAPVSLQKKSPEHDTKRIYRGKKLDVRKFKLVLLMAS